MFVKNLPNLIKLTENVDYRSRRLLLRRSKTRQDLQRAEKKNRFRSRLRTKVCRHSQHSRKEGIVPRHRQSQRDHLDVQRQQHFPVFA